MPHRNKSDRLIIFFCGYPWVQQQSHFFAMHDACAYWIRLQFNFYNLILLWPLIANTLTTAVNFFMSIFSISINHSFDCRPWTRIHFFLSGNYNNSKAYFTYGWKNNEKMNYKFAEFAALMGNNEFFRWNCRVGNW